MDLSSGLSVLFSLSTTSADVVVDVKIPKAVLKILLTKLHCLVCDRFCAVV